jgi:hypothetical protein
MQMLLFQKKIIATQWIKKIKISLFAEVVFEVSEYKKEEKEMKSLNFIVYLPVAFVLFDVLLVFRRALCIAADFEN